MTAERFERLLRCPETGAPLRRAGDAFESAGGPRWPIVRGVPRFVGGDRYVGSFSFEWNAHSTTQLDSRQGGRSSEEMLRDKTGLGPDDVRGRLVLDAGVGAGRFTDVLSRWGGDVVGVDLSYAVEAARANFAALPNVFIAQADIARLPFAPATFDLIVSIGVLHHTPDTRAHLERLVPLLRPGGTICIWVYPDRGAYRRRTPWIPFTGRLPARPFHRWCRWYVPFARRHPGNVVVQYFNQLFPVSDQGLGLENDVLDTFDGFSPRYHWVHEPDEVVGWFHAAGLEDVRALPWATAVRGRRPA